jgi:ribosomal-protein-alanine N-acetyltransferase
VKDPRDLQGRPVTIRPAGLADVDGMMAIETSSFLTPWPRSAMEDEITGNSFSRAVVAASGGEVLAFMIYWLVVDEVHLQNIATAPAWRGRGLARALMGHLIEEAGRSSCALVNLEVREGNGAARGLYESHGFVANGRRKRYYADSGEDAILMTLWIDPGKAPPDE